MYYISKYNIYLEDKVYNLISKNYVTVNEELLAYLKQNTKLSSSFPPKIIDVLKKNNIIVNYNENQYLDFKYNSLKFNSQKASFIIYPTLNCNFSCDYCFETVKTGLLSNSDAQILKKFFNEKIRIFNDINLRWSGGEPLLVWDKIKDITSVFEGYKGDFGVSMATNGYY